MKKAVKDFLIPIVAASVFLLLLVVSFADLLYESKVDVGMSIAQDVAILRDVFHRIHRDCTIIDFDNQKNSINFLTVAQFVGSEVGPMNLVYPKKWKGPYVKENPTMQKVAYQVVVTNKGFFVTPGDGVKLPNGKIVGKDIVLDKNADIPALMRDPQALLFKDRPLAAQLVLGAPANIQLFADGLELE